MNARAYYNEHEPYAAQWLRNLIAAGHIAPGDVDERDIQSITADDLRCYTQCHFFAGLGGWSLALRLAGWPNDRPVWTGSCPCQPFSNAGKKQGGADNRHLWPHWARLIGECRPPVIFGEQVASAVAHGWLDAVFDDLEAQNYACGAAIAPAASVGAPHIRDRLWFVANATKLHRNGGDIHRAINKKSASKGNSIWQLGGDCSDNPNANGAGLEISRDDGRIQCAHSAGVFATPPGNNWWSVEPDVGRVAHGVPARVGRLRAYGNAIVPHVAAEVIGAYMETRP
jgi:DNA (cytosine-5)-methyltransferase 1